MFPVIGTPANVLNTGLYLYEGDYGNAAMSAISLVPIPGGAFVTKAFRGTKRTASNLGKQVAKHVEKHAGDVAKGLHAKPSTTIGETLGRIKQGLKHPHKRDGTVFKNNEGLLPTRPQGFYREYVHESVNIADPGLERIIIGKNGDVWYAHIKYSGAKTQRIACRCIYC